MVLLILLAVLSAPGFNAAAQVRRASLVYLPPMNKLACTESDVNGDARPDLLCLFRVAEMGFQCGDTQGRLMGNLEGGTPILGQDVVRISPCP